MSAVCGSLLLSILSLLPSSSSSSCASTMCDRKCKDDYYCGMLNNRIQGLVIFTTKFLMEAISYKLSLVLILLTLRTNVQPTPFCSLGRVVSVYILLFNWELYSCSIAWSQWGLHKACLTRVGLVRFRQALGLKVFVSAHVIMGWVLT